MLFLAIVSGIFGSIVGSFLNVLVLRKGVASLGGRSHCPSCAKEIAAYDLVPIFSWMLLRGRCRNCGSKISIQYPIVEASTAVLFALVGAANPDIFLSAAAFLMLVARFTLVALLVSITVYDLYHTIIPDDWSYGFSALALVLALFAAPSWLTFFAGPIAALPLFVLWLVSQGRWMGLGDPKLAFGIGWLLGFPLGLVAIFFAFIIGTMVLVPMMAYERIRSTLKESGQVVTHTKKGEFVADGLTMKSEVPFGPFLIASCLIFWVLGLYGVEVPLYLLGL
jgi:leader peptidase (prepilin peptidase)/N-methyltransferase